MVDNRRRIPLRLIVTVITDNVLGILGVRHYIQT